MTRLRRATIHLPGRRDFAPCAAFGTHVHPARDEAGSRFRGWNNEAREEGVHEANIRGFANACICSVAGREPVSIIMSICGTLHVGDRTFLT